MNEFFFYMLAIFWIICGFHYIGGKAVSYILTKDSIEVRLFSIPVANIFYNNVDDIKLIQMWKADLYIPLIVVRSGYRLWGSGAVELKNRKGY
ncbi:MAG: hypothetical protein WAV76_10385 [Bacteroidota bacterium]